MRIFIVMVLFPLSVFAKGDYKCFNLAGGMEVIQKVEDHKYVIDMWNMLTPRFRLLLITDNTSFKSNGVVGSDKELWVKIPTGAAEHMALKQSNGFEKTYEVVRESQACYTEGPKADAAHDAAIVKEEDQPCEREQNGVIIINPHCKAPKRSPEEIAKIKAERRKLRELKEDCDQGYKPRLSEECIEAAKRQL